jgi:hypothetical protein
MKTRKSIKLGISILFLSLIFVSCKDTGQIRTAATGARFEILIVMDNQIWNAPAGQAVFELFDQDMPGLPQPEAMFKIMQVSPNNFSDFLKPTRNILQVDISPERFTQPRITYAKDLISFPQRYVRITAPSAEDLLNAIKTNGENILNFFVLGERERSMHLLESRHNRSLSREVQDWMGVQIHLPADMKHSTKRENFYWTSNQHGEIRQDIVIYSYPYTDPNTFTFDFLVAKRDSIMKHNIPGPVAGSFMGTELQFATPTMHEIWHNGEYAVEMFGLWKTMNGGSMGGPFYSLTRLDEVNQRVITVEGFVFAPGTNKRNAIRALEAVVHTLRLPQDVNRLPEVNVLASQNAE